jgi:hypothetical protein
MKHAVTIISDDCRLEVGNKVTLAGIYEEAIILRSLPVRLLKVSFYQRWSDFFDVEKVRILIRGSAIGETEIRAEAKPITSLKQTGNGRIILAVGPLDLLNQGTLEFHTFINDDLEASHMHQISVQADPNFKIIN